MYTSNDKLIGSVMPQPTPIPIKAGKNRETAEVNDEKPQADLDMPYKKSKSKTILVGRKRASVAQ